MHPDVLALHRSPWEDTEDLRNTLGARKTKRQGKVQRCSNDTIPETRYLHNVVGDIDIRKGEGMELDQLFQIASHYRETKARVCPFDLDILRDAFHMRETTPVNFDFTEKGIPTATAKLKSELKDKEKRHKRREDNNGKDHKKQKRLHMGKSSDKNKNGKANRFGIDNL
ncbi:hypothetical protein FNV43_RR06438 [Rhamnella rubrinervis]|uniref:Uncharacterized protein n=1 Tax=Rhamnella rubrinervis TaxID=2594499 RepID=A0A8K0HEK9_9ROSA|nr:hypothetical protein FNV43_RR06438 [Rhamnella rubrinervis]